MFCLLPSKVRPFGTAMSLKQEPILPLNLGKAEHQPALLSLMNPIHSLPPLLQTLQRAVPRPQPTQALTWSDTPQAAA